MQNSVEVWNGSTWITIWQSGGPPPVQDNFWTKQVHDVTAYKNANMKIRFGYNIGSSGVYSVSSWNLDDVRVVTFPSP